MSDTEEVSEKGHSTLFALAAEPPRPFGAAAVCADEKESF